MKRSLLLVAVLTLAVGCSKSEPAYYSGTETGFLKSGVFTTDNGRALTVDGNGTGFDIQTPRRVMATYETHLIDGSSDVTIDLLDLWDAVIPEPVPESDVPGETPDTPAQVSDAWFSAGYLNIFTGFFGEDAGLHGFTASYAFETRGIVIRLRHDGNGDTDTRETTQTAFVSLPMMGVVQAFDIYRKGLGLDLLSNIPVKLQWTWYKPDGDQLSAQTMLYEKEGVLYTLD